MRAFRIKGGGLEPNKGMERGDQTERYESIRGLGCTFSRSISRFCPESMERALAMTKIEEAVMWSIAAIARNE